LIIIIFGLIMGLDYEKYLINYDYIKNQIILYSKEYNINLLFSKVEIRYVILDNSLHFLFVVIEKEKQIIKISDLFPEQYSNNCFKIKFKQEHLFDSSIIEVVEGYNFLENNLSDTDIYQIEYLIREYNLLLTAKINTENPDCNLIDKIKSVKKLLTSFY
jgi:hypothetical protein